MTLFCFLILGIIFYLRPYYLLIKKITGVSPLKFIYSNGDFKQTAGNANFLLLGKAGGNHQGEYLTDSIMIASFNLKDQKINLISIPRDIWSDNLKDKINSAYYYGELKKKGLGFQTSQIEIAKIVGLPIHYGILIDFENFSKLIDYLGGIEVLVEQNFDDYKYPIAGKENDLCSGDDEFKCRFEHISFKKGLTYMNSSLALKFARSRNAQGKEGSDFARGKRQQKVITAIFDKMIKRLKRFEFNHYELEKLYSLIDSLVKRNIRNEETLFFLKNAFLFKKFKINNIALTEKFFIVPKYENYQGKYVLIPKDGNYAKIQVFLKCQMAGDTNCK